MPDISDHKHTLEANYIARRGAIKLFERVKYLESCWRNDTCTVQYIKHNKILITPLVSSLLALGWHALSGMFNMDKYFFFVTIDQHYLHTSQVRKCSTLIFNSFNSNFLIFVKNKYKPVGSLRENYHFQVRMMNRLQAQ